MSVRSEEGRRVFSLFGFRRVVALGVLAVAAALAACGNTSVTNDRSVQSVTVSTSAASVTSVPAAAGRDVSVDTDAASYQSAETTSLASVTSVPDVGGGVVGVDADTVWDDVFGVLSQSEMLCILDKVDRDLLALVGYRRVVPESRTPEGWEVSIFSCLDPQAARVLFHSVIVVAMGEELDLELSGEYESCVREWVAGLDVGAAVAALAGNGFSYRDYRDSLAARIVWHAPGSESYYVEVGFPGRTSSYPLTFFVSDTIGEYPCWIGGAEAVKIGESVQGRVDTGGDSDLFVWEAEEGRLYEIDVAWETMSEPVAAVTWGGGWESVSDSNEGFELAARVVWEASRSGSHYIDAGSFEEGGTGAYTLTIDLSDISDDHSGSASGATTVTIGEVVLGTVDYRRDVDVFVFEAEEGRLYDIDVALGTLPGSSVEVYDADGWLQNRSHDSYDCGESLALCLVWEALSSGSYYVEVSYQRGTGSYTLTINLSEIVDDHSGSEATPVTIGEPVQGTVNYVDDYDIFVFEAKEGLTYEIDVALGTLPDASVVVYDANYAHCWDSSCLEWEAPSSGRYYVGVESSDYRSTGTYTLTIDLSDISDDHSDAASGATVVTIGEPVQGTVNDVDDYDLDFFVFEAEEGQLYEIDVALGTLPDSFVAVYDTDFAYLADNYDCGDSPASCLVWKAPSSGSYYVEVGAESGTGSYTLTINLSDIIDDHSDSASGATAVTIGEPIQGMMDYVDDADFFVFEAEKGRSYNIDVALGTLSDSLVGVIDADYSELAVNDDCADTLASCLIWEAPNSGSYYVAVVSSEIGGTGSYTLTILTP